MIKTMKKPAYSITEAVDVSTDLLKRGALPGYILLALRIDGFNKTHAFKILEWAEARLN